MTVDHIRIDHIGPEDRSILSVIISPKKLTLPITETRFKSTKRFLRYLATYFKNNKYLNSEQKVNEFGVFKITKLVNAKTEIGFTPTRNDSIHLFKNLLDQLSNKQPSEKLVKEIKRILARIDFDKK